MDLNVAPVAGPRTGPHLAPGAVGDLAQSARFEAVRRARPILIGLGLFFLLLAAGGFAGREKAVEQFRTHAQKGIGPWEVFKWLDAAHKVVVYERGYTIFCWATVALGAIYPALALVISRYPASATILGTSLTIAVTCFIARLVVAGGGPGVIAAAIVILIVALILRALFRATRAGVALREQEEVRAEPGADDGLILFDGPPGPSVVERVAPPPSDRSPAPRPDDGILFIGDDGRSDDEPEARESPASGDIVPPIALEFAGRRTAWGAEVGLALAVALVALAATRAEGAPLLPAILVGWVALALKLTAEPGVRGRVTDRGIELDRPADRIGFHEIRSVDAGFFSFGPPPESFTIRVHHLRGSFTIPERRGNDSRALYRTIRDRVAPGGSRAVHPSLAGYLARNVAIFGEAKVWSYRASTHHEADRSRRRGSAIGLAMLASSFAWILIAATEESLERPWGPLGGLLLLVAILTLLVSRAVETRIGQFVRIKDWSASSLIITPVGLALIQGRLEGELAWDQILGVSLDGPHTRRGRVNGPGIILSVEGARIAIADLYDRPIAMIFEQILFNWDPRRPHHPIRPLG